MALTRDHVGSVKSLHSAPLMFIYFIGDDLAKWWQWARTEPGRPEVAKFLW